MSAPAQQNAAPQGSLASAQASGAGGTPTFFIDGQRWTGAIDAPTLIAGIEASITTSRAAATSTPGTGTP